MALVGDRSEHRSHRELDALRPRLREDCGVDTRWVATDAGGDLSSFDGVWLVPGSPYADDDAVLAALTTIRRGGQPFLGTCGGMQYAVLEYLRTELGADATHAETDAGRTDHAIVPLACSLQGVASEVRPVPGSRFAGWVREPFDGMHFCSFAASPESIRALADDGVIVGATGPELAAEVLEFPHHPFYVTSMFQPHIGASEGAAVHPLVAAFMDAVRV
ncbi:CTP synthase [Nocardioides fonticola]|uniref:CTP synthase n=1 Tax=Nocardioides fonticola TaxID=450363 RepID=A0ABP7XEN5_9ACTN